MVLSIDLPWSIALYPKAEFLHCIFKWLLLGYRKSVCLLNESFHYFLWNTVIVSNSFSVYWFKWTLVIWTHKIKSFCHYIYHCGQESLRRNGVAIIVNKRVQNAVLGCNLKWQYDLFVHFQGKPFSITVIQVCAPTSNAEEAEVERLYEDLQDLLELTPKKDVLFIIGDWNAKVGSQETPGVTG